MSEERSAAMRLQALGGEETASDPIAPASPVYVAFERLTRAVALLGGGLLLALALLVTASVTGRWLFSEPVPGDFEIAQMATAVAVFAFLPFGQMRRVNIVVDVFTSRLPKALTARIDGVWDIAYAALMGFIAYGLIYGTGDAMRYGTATMVMQLPIWPAIAATMGLAALVSVAALASGLLRIWSGR